MKLTLTNRIWFIRFHAIGHFAVEYELLEASKDVQYIIATHSPKIISGRVDHCLEL